MGRAVEGTTISATACNVHGKKQHHPSSDDDYHYKNYIKILLLLHIITIDLIIEMMRTIVTVIMGLPTAFLGTSRLHQE